MTAINYLSPLYIHSPIINSALELPVDNIAGNSNSIIEKGWWKVLWGKTSSYTDLDSTIEPDGIFYNQCLIDDYSCTLVGAFTNLSNITGIAVPVDVMNKAFLNYVASGEFVKNVWGYITDGGKWALQTFNEYANTNYRMNVVPLNVSNMITALKAGSAINCIIHYSNTYFSDEQDDATIEDVNNTDVGLNGHTITICKLNTLDDYLIKYCESFCGTDWCNDNIILVDFGKEQPKGLVGQSMIYYTNN